MEKLQTRCCRTIRCRAVGCTKTVIYLKRVLAQVGIAKSVLAQMGIARSRAMCADPPLLLPPPLSLYDEDLGNDVIPLLRSPPRHTPRRPSPSPSLASYVWQHPASFQTQR